MPAGIAVGIALGLIVAAGVANRHLWRRRHPVTPAARDVPVLSGIANDSVEDVARWEGEGGAVVRR
jgi:hypothetical protein